MMREKNNIRLKGLLAIVFTMALTACDGGDKYKEIHSRALSNPDAWSALNIFREEIYSHNHELSSLFDYLFYYDPDEGREIEKALYIKALEQNSKPALVHIFTTYSHQDEGLFSLQYLPSDLMRKNAKALVETAEVSLGETSEFYLAAADVLANGRWVMKNEKQAISMYLRAWALDSNTRAAKNISETYSSFGDVENAYLWGVRAMVDAATLKEIESKLTTKQILNIQELARDSSVTTVSTLITER